MRYEHIRKAARNLQLVLAKGAPTTEQDRTHFQEGLWELLALLEEEWAYKFGLEDDLTIIAGDESLMLAQKELLDLYLALKKLDEAEQ